MNDPLHEATRALRAQVTRDPTDAEATRWRLLRSATRRERARKIQIASAVALALLLTNSTTWALSTGRLPRALDSLAEAFGTPATRDAASPTRDDDDARRSAAFPAPVEPPASPADQAEEPTAAVIPAAAPDPLAAPRASGAEDRSGSRPVPAPDSGGTPIDTHDRESFAAAHALHFGGAAPAVALRAWDDYLAELPAGRFVPEAEWNRALCLVRLGRFDDAQTALAPFAEGAHGGIRRDEARALIAAITER